MEPLLLEIEGMKCGGCVRAVEQRLLAQPGVRQTSVNLITRTAWVDVDPSLAADVAAGVLPSLQPSLAGLGFGASLREQAAAPAPAPGADPATRLWERRWWRRWQQLVVALAPADQRRKARSALVDALQQLLKHDPT